MSEMPISEVSGHLDEVANESAATGEVIALHDALGKGFDQLMT